MAGVNTAQGFEAMSSVGLRPFSAHTTSSYNPSLHRRKSSQGQQAAAQMALQESTEDRGSDSTTALHGATEHHGQFEPSALALLVGGYHTSTQRPLDPAVSTLIEAAHHKHATRKLAHPVTYTYSMFDWRVKEAAESTRLASATASQQNSHPTSKRSSATNALTPGMHGPSISAHTSPRPSSIDGLCLQLGLGTPRSTQHPGPISDPTTALSHSTAHTGAVPGSSGPTPPPVPPPVPPLGLHRRLSSGGNPHALNSSASSVVSLNVSCRGPPAPSLEVVCEYDAHFQVADILGRHGQLVRPQPHSQVGPVAWLFRWYAKRGTQFAEGGPTAEDLADAPPMPPVETTESVGSSSTSATTSGRRVNRAPDPVINCEELIDLLEDFEIVPKWVTRADVARLFAAAAAVKSDPRNKLAKAGMQPAEIRYVQFCDVLVRVAIVAAAVRDATRGLGRSLLRSSADGAAPPATSAGEGHAGAGPGSGGRVAAGRLSTSFSGATPASSGTSQSGAPGSRVLPTRQSLSGPLKPTGSLGNSIAAGASTAAGPLPPGRQAEAQAATEAARASGPQAALKALMDALELTHPTLLPLRHKLDALARMAKERGAAKKANKWMYIAASNQSAVAAALRAPPMPGLEGWNVLSESRAPAFLHQLLLAHDAQSGAAYTPCWRTFKEPALNLGAMQPGEVRCCRVVLRNRGRNKMHVRVDATGAPWASCTFNETCLAPGVPRVVDLTFKFPDMGEFCGELGVHTLASGDSVQRLNIVPTYALVGLPDAERRVPSCRSERASFAHKAAAGGAHLPPRGPTAMRTSGPGSVAGSSGVLPQMTATHSVYSGLGGGALQPPSSVGGGSGSLARQGSGRVTGFSSRGVSEDGGGGYHSLGGRSSLNATAYFAPGVLAWSKPE